MLTKINFYIIALLIIVISIFYFKENVPTKIEIKVNSKPLKENIVEGEKGHKKNLTQLKQETTQEEKTDTKQETIINIYDSDPVVDSAMMIENNRMCYGFLSKRFNSLRVSYILDNNYDEKQKQYHKSYLAHCRQLNQTKPELELTNIAAIETRKSTAEATSLWGKILSREIDPSTLSEYEQLDLLRQNDINILSNAPNYLRDYYNKVIHWDLEDVLQNRQYDYVSLIQDYAHNLHLCQNGKDCGPNSSHMALICLYLTSQACGLNYEQFINQVLSPGQQSDIALASIYLSNKYQ